VASESVLSLLDVEIASPSWKATDGCRDSGRRTAQAGNRSRAIQDELEVLRSFVTYGVRFVVIGGRAVQFHGHVWPATDR